MPVTVERLETILKETLSALADTHDCAAAADLGILDSAIDLTEATVKTFEEAEYDDWVCAAEHSATTRGVIVEWPNGRRFFLPIIEAP